MYVIYICIYLSYYFVLTNTVFLNTTSGSRKLPEYLIFASHEKFKIIVVSDGYGSCGREDEVRHDMIYLL